MDRGKQSLASLQTRVSALRGRAGSVLPALDRWVADVAAAAFHLSPRDKKPLVVCLLGGTGTGKSTLVNRLLNATVTAASFRRTFTAGPVAIFSKPADLPADWLGLPHIAAAADQLPVRGQVDQLLTVQHPSELTDQLVLVDTPDLDGDQPAHHAQAERAFRWAEAAVFVVSPEKYQMTELWPYYRLARRYALSAIFVMNKCETAEMLEDYRQQLEAEQAGAKLFAIARDDAAYEPPAEANLPSLRSAIGQLVRSPADARDQAAKTRVADVLGRLRDQVLQPLRDTRRETEQAAAAVLALDAPTPGIEVDTISEQLQRRLQQRSVLYLIGPGRMLDRVRQAPALLARLPRTAWDLLIKGKPANLDVPADTTEPRQPPDFARVLADQFTILQTRIDDTLREFPRGQKWLADSSYAASRIDATAAGAIATEELADLTDWLQKRWNATPRDTALLLKLVRHLPGGEKLTQWSEAAPYLLAIIVAAHHAFFGHIDLMILGGYTLATWLTEKLSNEVASRTRKTNRAIAERFEKLAREQIRRTLVWLDAQSPPREQIELAASEADALQESLQT